MSDPDYGPKNLRAGDKHIPCGSAKGHGQWEGSVLAGFIPARICWVYGFVGAHFTCARKIRAKPKPSGGDKRIPGGQVKAMGNGGSEGFSGGRVHPRL